MKLDEALAELRKSEKRKFEQSFDLIVNLKGINLKKDQLNIIAEIPNKVEEKKICGFLKTKSKSIPSITEPEFQKYKEKKALKKLVNEYDYFVASAPLMPKVATAFGKVLGPAGKMPSPQLGILMQEDDVSINKVIEKISKSIKIRMKEPSIKLKIGRENMKDEEIIGNVKSVYGLIENSLPKKKENVKSIMIKLSMSKPIKFEAV